MIGLRRLLSTHINGDQLFLIPVFGIEKHAVIVFIHIGFGYHKWKARLLVIDDLLIAHLPIRIQPDHKYIPAPAHPLFEDQPFPANELWFL